MVHNHRKSTLTHTTIIESVSIENANTLSINYII